MGGLNTRFIVSHFWRREVHRPGVAGGFLLRPLLSLQLGASSLVSSRGLPSVLVPLWGLPMWPKFLLEGHLSNWIRAQRKSSFLS